RSVQANLNNVDIIYARALRGPPHSGDARARPRAYRRSQTRRAPMTQVADATHALSTLSNQFADAVERVGRAVVQVNGRPRRPSSGVVYAPDLVLAADHAVEREDDLSVETAHGPARAAQLVGRDPASDLAMLRVAGLGAEPALPAPAPARVGQLVLAVG